jgi:hypothetical protein
MQVTWNSIKKHNQSRKFREKEWDCELGRIKREVVASMISIEPMLIVSRDQ